VDARLAFESVVLSGRHHFRSDCEEDWCTHCLDVGLLVASEDGSYRTVIDRHIVDTSDPEYGEWQAKCGTLSGTAVFQVSPGAELVFKDCELLDIRYRPFTFVWLSGSSLVLTNTTIKRINADHNFLLVEENSLNSVTIASCYVTGFNRDHAYTPGFTMDTSFLVSFWWGQISLTISNSTFENNLVHHIIGMNQGFLDVYVLDLQLTDSVFLRNTGILLFFCMETQQRLISNVTFQAHFSIINVLSVLAGGPFGVTLTSCSFIDNHSHLSIVEGPLIQDKMLYRNNRILQNYQSAIFTFIEFFEQITNSVFDNNGNVDRTFQAYWANFYLDQGLLNEEGLREETEAQFLLSNGCLATLHITAAYSPKLTNVTLVEDRVTACASSLLLSMLFPDDGGLVAELQGIWINTRAASALNAQVQGTIVLENSVLEHGGRLLVLEAASPSTLLLASNVTFQYASGIKARKASVSLILASGNFERCKWRHNEGYDSGALAVYEGNLIVQDSLFLNNSCRLGAGDVLFAAGQSGTVTLNLSSSTFTQSRSSLGAACLLVTGDLSAGAQIVSSVFRSSVSYSGAVLQLTHYAGQLLLIDLTMLEINSLSTSLVLVMTSSSASTFIERWKVLNCLFHKGLVVLADGSWPQVSCHWNEFVGNNGTAVWVSAGNYSDRGSEYKANTGLLPLYYQGGGSTGLLQAVLFSNNSPSETMGLVFLEGRNSALSLLNCTFRSNSAPRAIALLELQQDTNAAIVNCSFQDNRVFGAVIFAELLSFAIHNSSFTNHSSVLQLEEAHALITLSTISGAQSLSSLIQSSLTMQSSAVRELTGAKNCLLSGFTSNVSLVDVVIERVHCDGEVVTIIVGSRLLLERTQVRFVESGTSVFVVKVGAVILTQTSLRQVVSRRELISLTNSSLTMSDTTVTESPSSVLQASESSLLLERCHFADIHTVQQVGVLACSACFNLTVSACTMEEISAKSVAGILADTRALQVMDSVFHSLQGADSGALQVHADHAVVSACSFLANSASASDSSGGALRLNATTALISTTLFRNNSAASGGAVHWIAGNAVWQRNTLQENTALYGPDIASFPTHLRADQDPIVISSGYPFESALVVRLLDHFEQVVTLDDWTTAELNSSEAVSESVQVKAVAGLLIFTGFTFTAPPGSRSRLNVTTAHLTLSLTLAFRTCQIGEAETERMCVRCSTGTYSLRLNSTECKLCLENAHCLGGSKIYPEAGGWRPDELFEEVLRCPRAEACLGHVNFGSEVGYCGELYTGNLCQSCAEGAGRVGRDGCTSCLSSSAQEGQAAGLSVWVLGLWLFVSANHSPEKLSLLRIAVHYLQFLTLVTDFDLNWPDSLQDFYYLHRYLGNAVQHLVSMQCLTSEAFFVSTLAAALAPLALLFLFAGVWALVWVVSALFKSSITISKLYASSVLVGFMYMHCFIVRIALAAFHCITIKTGERWLRAELTVRCWDKRHLAYALAVSLPTVLLWGLGVPGLLLLLQIRQHKQGSASPMSFLSQGFKQHVFYWELVVLGLKTCVVVLYIGMANLLPSTQALSLVLLLCAALVLQFKVAPWQTTALNRSQLASLSVALATAYSGLYFTSDEPSPVLVTIVLFLHCSFVLYWGRAYCGAKLKIRALRWLNRG